MLTATVKEFLTGVWEGPESVWRRRGRPVGLGNIAGERRYRPGPMTGHSLAHARPSAEVWDKPLAEELVWQEELSGGSDAELPPGGPQPPEQLRLQLNGLETQDSPAGAAPATPPPAPAAIAPAAWDLALQRSRGLARINLFLGLVDKVAASRLNREGLSEAERLCLKLVQAIMSYGLCRHSVGEGSYAEYWLRTCLELQQEHQRVVRSGKLLWRLTASPAETGPYAAVERILAGHPSGRREASRIFGNWRRMVDDAARAAGRARARQRETAPGDSGC